MARKAVQKAAWEDPFIEALQEIGVVARAARAAGIGDTLPYKRRKDSPAFAERWENAKETARTRSRQKSGSAEETTRKSRVWRQAFLSALAETSNVSAAANSARVSTREAYELRRDDRRFAAQWQSALFEGYRNLEMEVLGHLRDPDPPRKMDVAGALRLLAAHRETAQREGAKRQFVSAAEVRASIERKVEKLRQRVAAEQGRGECSE